MNDINFGELLRALRENRDLSQKELAYKSNIDPSHLNKIEKGYRMPSDDVLFRLADVLVAIELFQAAGRVVPPKFEKKHPLKISPSLKKIEERKEILPGSLKRLLALYQNQYDTIANKSYTINVKAFELSGIRQELNIKAGKIDAVFEIWSEINKTIEKDMVSFITDFFKIDKNDAEFVSEIVEVIKRRNTPKS